MPLARRRHPWLITICVAARSLCQSWKEIGESRSNCGDPIVLQRSNAAVEDPRWSLYFIKPIRQLLDS